MKTYTNEHTHTYIHTGIYTKQAHTHADTYTEMHVHTHTHTHEQRYMHRQMNRHMKIYTDTIVWGHPLSPVAGIFRRPSRVQRGLFTGLVDCCAWSQGEKREYIDGKDEGRGVFQIYSPRGAVNCAGCRPLVFPL